MKCTNIGNSKWAIFLYNKNMENYITAWKYYFKEYIDNKEYKIWDMDTSFFKILKNFQQKVVNIPENKCLKLDVVFAKTNEKQTKYYSLCINGENITPSTRKSEVSWGAMRQYLSVFDLMGIIKFNGQIIKGNFTFDIWDTSFKNEKPEDVIAKAAKRILLKGKNFATKYGKNAWFSIILSLIYKNNSDLAIQIFEDNLYTKAKTRKEINAKEVLEEIKYTYEDFTHYLNPFFEKFYKDRLINSLFENENNNLRIEYINPEQKINKIIEQKFKLLNDKRAAASKTIRAIRNYIGETDLENIETHNRTLDAAHILSYKKIKYEMLLEFSKKDFSLERIDELINMIDDMENIILIPHNYHYLLDKDMLNLNMDGIFKVNVDEKTIRNFGILNNIRIKRELMTPQRIKYIRMQ